MNRRRKNSIAGNPLLIGGITALIVVVAVFLSYNANNGLPFVPTYDIKVQLAEASGLQKANQVRVAGNRVGIVKGLTLQQNKRTGQIWAIAELQLEKKLEPLPADTKAIVQSVSAIGLKYLELQKGTSSQTIPAGGTIPVAHTSEPVNIEDLFNMFQKPTRTAIKINTNNFGDGLAGRGLSLNQTIYELRPLVINAVPVLNNLASQATDLHGFFVGLNAAASQAAPVAESQATYYTDLAIFFRAFASVTPSLEAATVGGPPALEQAIYTLPRTAELTEKSTEFMKLLQPSAKLLRTLAAPLGHAVTVGAVNLRAASSLNQQLAESAVALEEFTKNPIVTLAFEDFSNTLASGNPLLAGFAPTQAQCNYVTLAFRNVASLESETVGVGTVARSGFVLSPQGPNAEGFPSSAPANGPSTELAAGGSGVIDSNHVHLTPYPNVAATGQRAVCEAGNEEYAIGKAVIGPAAKVFSNREFTTRSQNLYGETYPQATLEALGIKGKKK